ncbi:MAG: hypothetical protein EAX86_05935 [Candidatus Heimdallarchaeota archaeon]|nr:hypothetical protein [Candidatus Heimdallarchaeota archaeon]
MEELKKKSRGKLLDRSKDLIFSTALEDSASKLCRLNFLYGLAKMHLVQDSLGLEPNSTFIAAPDCTITRNIERWKNGIGYGGKVTWGDGDIPLMFVDTMPNACGMLVGSLTGEPDPMELIQRIHDMNDAQYDVEIEGVPIRWNFGSGNHFINVFEVFPNPAMSESANLPQYSFITHSSPSELKGDSNPKELGLYYHASSNLREMCQTLETPFGEIHYLIGEDAKKYYDFYKWAERIGEKKRELAGKLLFGNDYEVISNTPHQGLTHLNEVALGTYVFTNNEEKLYPLTLRADIPCYILKGISNFNDDAQMTLNFKERMDKYNLHNRISNANILPHGGGYTFPHIVAIPEIFETVQKRRYFSVDLGTGIGTMVFETPSELQFLYRGRNVLVQTIDLGLGEIVARMVPRFALKV